MRKLEIIIIIMVSLLFSGSTVHAVLVDITDSSLPHFGDFFNQLPNAPDDYSNISNNAPTDGNFGWHNSPSDGPSLSGMLFGSNSFKVTTLRLQVHVNPFRDFILQGSTDTINGFDGSWNNLLFSTITERTENAWVEWDFSNNTSYTAFRINALNDYSDEPLALGWAMHRWELLADDGQPVIPEPATVVLMGAGLVGIIGARRKRKA